jgi:tRNA-specific 2-thiouridylase
MRYAIAESVRRRQSEMMYNQDGRKRGHAIALFSGGLDSALAILLILRQEIKVTALTFMTHFGCDLGDRSSCGSNPFPTAEKFGFNVKLMHLGQKFVDIVANPQFGRGREMNVCIDCRILMLREAKAFMEMTNADFIITGEVLGQRPFSQVRDKLRIVEREAGLQGRLLRPLSAKLLPPTDPELGGLVDRDRLEGIKGRSRRRQLELAVQFGLEDYPTPAGGCLLTDHGYSNRLRDLMEHSERLTFDDLNLLKLGRHFRLDHQTRIVVGRNEAENNQLAAMKKDYHCLLEARDFGSPLTLLIGDLSDANLRLAGAITARYSSGRHRSSVSIKWIRLSDEHEETIEVPPASDEQLTPLAIR